MIVDNFIGYPEVLTLANRSIDSLRELMRRGKFPRAAYRRGAKRLWLRAEVEEAIAKLALPTPLSTLPAES